MIQGNTKTTRPKCFLVFTCIIFLFSSQSFAAQMVIDHIAAVIGKSIVSQSDVDAFRAKKSADMLDEFALAGKSPQDVFSSDSEALNYLINEKLLDIEVKKQNLAVTMDRVDQEIREIAKLNNLSKDQFLSAIKAQGVSVSDYQDLMKSRIERRSLIEVEISSKIRISDDEVQAEYLRRNPEAKVGVPLYSVAHIFISAKKRGFEKASDKANQVYGLLQSGMDFATVAEQNTQDTRFSNGGFLGEFRPGEMSPDFEKAVAQLKIGEFSQPVKTLQGYHILKLTNKSMTMDATFEKDKERFHNFLFDQAFKRFLRNWLEAKKEDNFVSVKSEKL